MLSNWCLARKRYKVNIHKESLTIYYYFMLNTHQKQNLILKLWDYSIVYFINMYWYLSDSQRLEENRIVCSYTLIRLNRFHKIKNCVFVCFYIYSTCLPCPPVLVIDSKCGSRLSCHKLLLAFWNAVSHQPGYYIIIYDNTYKSYTRKGSDKKLPIAEKMDDSVFFFFFFGGGLLFKHVTLLLDLFSKSLGRIRDIILLAVISDILQYYELQ